MGARRHGEDVKCTLDAVLSVPWGAAFPPVVRRPLLDGRRRELDGVVVAELPQFFRRPGVLEQDAVDVEGVELAGAVSIDGLPDAGHQHREVGLVVLGDHRARRLPLRFAGHGGRLRRWQGPNRGLGPAAGAGDRSSPLYRVALRDTLWVVIVSFRHKGLERLYRDGSKKGVQARHVPKLLRILSALDVAQAPEDLSIPSFRTHRLKGDLAGHWSIWVNGNWRVTFRFVDNDVELVDYQDYH